MYRGSELRVYSRIGSNQSKVDKRSGFEETSEEKPSG
jgi:hypothetical protein